MKNKFVKNIVPMIPLILMFVFSDWPIFVKILTGFILSVIFYQILFWLGLYPDEKEDQAQNDQPE